VGFLLKGRGSIISLRIVDVLDLSEVVVEPVRQPAAGLLVHCQRRLRKLGFVIDRPLLLWAVTTLLRLPCLVVSVNRLTRNNGSLGSFCLSPFLFFDLDHEVIVASLSRTKILPEGHLAAYLACQVENCQATLMSFCQEPDVASEGAWQVIQLRDIVLILSDLARCALLSRFALLLEEGCSQL